MAEKFPRGKYVISRLCKVATIKEIEAQDGASILVAMWVAEGEQMISTSREA